MSPRLDGDDDEAAAAQQVEEEEEEEEEEEVEEGIETVLVAVSKHSSSLSALKWTLSHKIAKANCSLKLLHILCSKPTPVDRISPEATATYTREIRLKTEHQLKAHQQLCDAWKVHAELIIVEGNDVRQSLVDQIIKLKAKTFIIGSSDRNGLLRKLKGSSVSDFVTKHASGSCKVIVVSKEKVLSIREANWVPDLLHQKHEKRSNDSSSDSSTGKSGVQRRGDRVCISQPLPLHMQRAACLTNLRHGWSSTPTFADSNTIMRLSSIGNLTIDSSYDPRPWENIGKEAEEHKPGGHISKVLERYGSDEFYQEDRRSWHRSMFSEDDFGSPGSSLGLDYITQTSSDGVAGENRKNLGEESEHKNVDQDHVQGDLHNLKVELERVQQKMIKAEEAVAMALQKENELNAYVEDERRKREQALIIAQVAKKEAVIEAKKFDEALIALKAVKLMAKKESQMRKEAEDRANKEALDRQKALSALQQAQMRYRQYSFEELEVATDGFSELNQIGVGGYGPVYKGKLHHTVVAIKVLKKDSVQGPKEFQQEVDFLSRMHHPHLVLLLGACRERGCLVYEYLVNGSLDDRLHCKGGTQPLPWHLRLRIIAEVTTALVFLHSSKPDPYVHRDLKPANILLDQNFSAKLGDVGLARLAPSIASYSVTVYKEDTNPVGTFAYIDPEYQRTGVFTPRSDVYALGLIMLQLLTGKGPIGLTTIVDVALREKKFEEVLDPMAGNWPISEAMEMATMAIHCSELKRKNRPCLEDDILPKLLKLRSFADDHVAQMAWSSMQTVSEPSRAVPSFFICPISKEIMKDPHIAADGYTYEYTSIKQWLRDHKTSPITHTKLQHRQLTPNVSLRLAISDWNKRLSNAAA